MSPIKFFLLSVLLVPQIALGNANFKDTPPGTNSASSDTPIDIDSFCDVNVDTATMGVNFEFVFWDLSDLTSTGFTVETTEYVSGTTGNLCTQFGVDDTDFVGGISYRMLPTAQAGFGECEGLSFSACQSSSGANDWYVYRLPAEATPTPTPESVASQSIQEVVYNGFTGLYIITGLIIFVLTFYGMIFYFKSRPRSL